MHFATEIRFNPAKGCEQTYYRIRHAFRDALNRCRHRNMLTVGYWDDKPEPEDVAAIGRCLNYMYAHKGRPDLFGDALTVQKPVVREFALRFWRRMLEEGSIDAVEGVIEESERKAAKMLDSDTMEHAEGREAGAEWCVMQAIGQLRLREFLHSKGWTGRQVDDAVACLVTRTVYGASERRSMALMDDNSAVCELVYGSPDVRPSHRSVYATPDRLLELKPELERHLCSVTDDLFNQRNRILLFDLTNFYFEGRKEHSRKAKFGRSKEKRYDCRLLVLALCVNTAGFIRYSSVLEGNTADPASLPDMVERVIAASPVADDPRERALVVIDAGIATEDNLRLIRERGFNYLCVSRSRLKDVELRHDAPRIVVHDTLKREISLAQVEHQPGGDYYLQVTSPAKALTESSMNRQWRERLETELRRAKDALSKKGGTKRYEKVIERVGRAMARYPSVAKYYDVSYVRSTENPTLMADISWHLKDPQATDKQCGVYYLRTSVATLDERLCWEYYNIIREIECTNRQLKTDLNMRPIFHRTDDRAEAHLFFGLLSYWVVNTIRHQLKQHGIKHYWSEIVRQLSTQKLVATKAVNALGQEVEIRQFTRPNSAAAAIYAALGYKESPFKRKRKICSPQSEISKIESPPPQSLTPT